MVPRKADLLQDILDNFQAKASDTLLAMVTTRDGLSVASTRNDSIAAEEDALAVAASRISEMTSNINDQLKQGEIGRILIEGSNRTTIVSSAGRDTLFIVVVPADAKLGLTMLAISNAARSIARVYN